MTTRPWLGSASQYLIQQRSLLSQWLRDHDFRVREAGPGFFICYQSTSDSLRVYLDIKCKDYLQAIGAQEPAKQVYARLEIKGPEGYVMHSEEWDATPAWLEEVLG